MGTLYHGDEIKTGNSAAPNVIMSQIELQYPMLYVALQCLMLKASNARSKISALQFYLSHWGHGVAVLPRDISRLLRMS